LIFWAKNRKFLPVRRANWREDKNIGLQLRNGLHFWIQHQKSWLLVAEQEILRRFGPPKGQKTPKNGQLSTFLTHRKQSWENEVLEGKMSSKFKNSSWVGKQTKHAFQKAHLGTFLTPENAPKQAPKWHDALRIWRGAKGKKCHFALVSRNFGSRLLQVGPLIYTSVFWNPR